MKFVWDFLPEADMASQVGDAKQVSSIHGAAWSESTHGNDLPLRKSSSGSRRSRRYLYRIGV